MSQLSIIPRGALIVVADGAKALFLRNKGSPRDPELEVALAFEQLDAPTRELGTDRPGRASSTVGGQRSAIKETDWHRLGEERFASDIAAELRRLADEDPRQQFVLVAPPGALGDLRKALEKPVARNVVAEVAKDLTSHPLPEIQRLLRASRQVKTPNG